MDKKSKKGLAALIIEASPMSKKKDMAESEESSSTDKDIAAEELLSAIESKEASAVAEALTSFIKLCEYDTEEE